MTSPDRAALEHENWIAYLTGVAGRSARVQVRRVGGALALHSDVPFDWLDQVLVERQDATLDDLLAAAGPPVRSARGPLIRLRNGVDDRFIPQLLRDGWLEADPATVTPGMVAFPIQHLAAPARMPRGLEIRRVTDFAGIEVHRDVVTRGFGSSPDVAVETTSVDLLDAPEVAIYVGLEDDRPVTSGLGWRTGRTIGVYAISTIPEARRRGYAEAMTARVVADGFAAGCDLAALQASVAGQPLYERLGFRVDVRYVAYARGAPPR